MRFRAADLLAMRQALKVAPLAATSGDVPVGALVLDAKGEVLAQGCNTRERDADPVGHAEINALRAAARWSGTWNLSGCTLVVTLEPCLACAGAALLARMSRIVFGAWDEKFGACGSVWDVTRDAGSPVHPEVVAGVLETECAQILTAFFKQQRLSKGSP